MTIGDFFTMAAVIVAACLVYNFVKAYKRSICHVNGVLYRIYNTGIDR